MGYNTTEGFARRVLLELWKERDSGDYVLLCRNANFNARRHTIKLGGVYCAAYTSHTYPLEGLPRLGEYPKELIDRNRLVQVGFWNDHPFRIVTPYSWVLKPYPLRRTAIISKDGPTFCCMCKRKRRDCWNCRPQAKHPHIPKSKNDD